MQKMASNILLDDLQWLDNIETVSDESTKVPSANSGVHGGLVEIKEDNTEAQSSVKKRGRPVKEEQKRKRTRESERVKKCPQIMTYDATYISKCLWSRTDKIKFLRGLEEFGPNNLKGIQTYLPDKTEKEIKSQIRMWSDFAQIDFEKKLPVGTTGQKKKDFGFLNSMKKVEEWTHHFEEMRISDNLRLSALSNVFLLIAEYGKFSPPSELNGVDLRAMYRYVHCMLNGIPYHGVNKETASALNESIVDLIALLKERKSVAELQPHLFCLPIPNRPLRTYNPHRNRRIIPTSKNPESMLKHLDFNPLKIPPSALTKKYIELYDGDEFFDMDNLTQPSVMPGKSYKK